MIDLFKKTILIYDYGLCISIAQKLGEKFNKVYYYVPWADAFPKSDKALIGDGLQDENVYRITNFWDYVDNVDLICFFDTYNYDIVEYLREHNYRVFGAGLGEMLENDRWYGRTIQNEVGLPTQQTVKIIGIENLKKFLKSNNNKYIKISRFRGDIETFYHEDYESSKLFLDYLTATVEPKQDKIEFIVEEVIEGIEPGYDGFVVDGKYPDIAMWGYEMKGTGYVSKVDKYANFPEPIRLVNDKLSEVFERLKTKSMFSTEIRVNKEGIGYLIDPTVRSAMPVPTAVELEIYDNLPEFIWEASDGNVIDLQPIAKYGAGVSLNSDWASEHWLEIHIKDEEVLPYIKFRRFMKQNNKYYIVPGFSSVCSVIGLGDKISDAVEMVKENVKKISGFELDHSTSGLDNIMELIEKGETEYNLKF